MRLGGGALPECSVASVLREEQEEEEGGGSTVGGMKWEGGPARGGGRVVDQFFLLFKLHPCSV